MIGAKTKKSLSPSPVDGAINNALTTTTTTDSTTTTVSVPISPRKRRVKNRTFNNTTSSTTSTSASTPISSLTSPIKGTKRGAGGVGGASTSITPPPTKGTSAQPSTSPSPSITSPSARRSTRADELRKQKFRSSPSYAPNSVDSNGGSSSRVGSSIRPRPKCLDYSTSDQCDVENDEENDHELEDELQAIYTLRSRRDVSYSSSFSTTASDHSDPTTNGSGNDSGIRNIATPSPNPELSLFCYTPSSTKSNTKSTKTLHGEGGVVKGVNPCSPTNPCTDDIVEDQDTVPSLLSTAMDRASNHNEKEEMKPSITNTTSPTKSLKHTFPTKRSSRGSKSLTAVSDEPASPSSTVTATATTMTKSGEMTTTQCSSSLAYLQKRKIMERKKNMVKNKKKVGTNNASGASAKSTDSARNTPPISNPTKPNISTTTSKAESTKRALSHKTKTKSFPKSNAVTTTTTKPNHLTTSHDPEHDLDASVLVTQQSFVSLLSNPAFDEAIEVEATAIDGDKANDSAVQQKGKIREGVTPVVVLNESNVMDLLNGNVRDTSQAVEVTVNSASLNSEDVKDCNACVNEYSNDNFNHVDRDENVIVENGTNPNVEVPPNITKKAVAKDVPHDAEENNECEKVMKGSINTEVEVSLDRRQSNSANSPKPKNSCASEMHRLDPSQGTLSAVVDYGCTTTVVNSIDEGKETDLQPKGSPLVHLSQMHQGQQLQSQEHQRDQSEGNVIQKPQSSSMLAILRQTPSMNSFHSVDEEGLLTAFLGQEKHVEDVRSKDPTDSDNIRRNDGVDVGGSDDSNLVSSDLESKPFLPTKLESTVLVKDEEQERPQLQTDEKEEQGHQHSVPFVNVKQSAIDTLSHLEGNGKVDQCAIPSLSGMQSSLTVSISEGGFGDSSGSSNKGNVVVPIENDIFEDDGDNDDGAKNEDTRSNTASPTDKIRISSSDGVATGSCAYDTRSIMEVPPSPPTPKEEKENDEDAGASIVRKKDDEQKKLHSDNGEWSFAASFGSVGIIDQKDQSDVFVNKGAPSTTVCNDSAVASSAISSEGKGVSNVGAWDLTFDLSSQDKLDSFIYSETSTATNINKDDDAKPLEGDWTAFYSKTPFAPSLTKSAKKLDSSGGKDEMQKDDEAAHFCSDDVPSNKEDLHKEDDMEEGGFSNNYFSAVKEKENGKAFADFSSNGGEHFCNVIKQAQSTQSSIFDFNEQDSGIDDHCESKETNLNQAPDSSNGINSRPLPSSESSIFDFAEQVTDGNREMKQDATSVQVPTTKDNYRSFINPIPMSSESSTTDFDQPSTIINESAQNEENSVVKKKHNLDYIDPISFNFQFSTFDCDQQDAETNDNGTKKDRISSPTLDQTNIKVKEKDRDDVGLIPFSSYSSTFDQDEGKDIIDCSLKQKTNQQDRIKIYNCSGGGLSNKSCTSSVSEAVLSEEDEVAYDNKVEVHIEEMGTESSDTLNSYAALDDDEENFDFDDENEDSDIAKLNSLIESNMLCKDGIAPQIITPSKETIEKLNMLDDSQGSFSILDWRKWGDLVIKPTATHDSEEDRKLLEGMGSDLDMVAKLRYYDALKQGKISEALPTTKSEPLINQTEPLTGILKNKNANRESETLHAENFSSPHFKLDPNIFQSEYVNGNTDADRDEVDAEITSQGNDTHSHVSLADSSAVSEGSDGSISLLGGENTVKSAKSGRSTKSDTENMSQGNDTHSHVSLADSSTVSEGSNGLNSLLDDENAVKSAKSGRSAKSDKENTSQGNDTHSHVSLADSSTVSEGSNGLISLLDDENAVKSAKSGRSAKSDTTCESIVSLADSNTCENDVTEVSSIPNSKGVQDIVNASEGPNPSKHTPDTADASSNLSSPVETRPQESSIDKSCIFENDQEANDKEMKSSSFDEKQNMAEGKGNMTQSVSLQKSFSSIENERLVLRDTFSLDERITFDTTDVESEVSTHIQSFSKSNEFEIEDGSCENLVSRSNSSPSSNKSKEPVLKKSDCSMDNFSFHDSNDDEDLSCGEGSIETDSTFGGDYYFRSSIEGQPDDQSMSMLRTLPPPPPPPPPPRAITSISSQRVNEDKTPKMKGASKVEDEKDESHKKIPLLKPIPTEKLKIWLDSKKNHPGSVGISTPIENSNASYLVNDVDSNKEVRDSGSESANKDQHINVHVLETKGSESSSHEQLSLKVEEHKGSESVTVVGSKQIDDVVMSASQCEVILSGTSQGYLLTHKDHDSFLDVESPKKKKNSSVIGGEINFVEKDKCEIYSVHGEDSDTLEITTHAVPILKSSPLTNDTCSNLDESKVLDDSRIAEKIAMASSSAERKFQEHFSPIASSSSNIDDREGVRQGLSPSSLYACFAQVNQENSSTHGEKDLCLSPMKGELVRGAFSPWKNGDYADSTFATSISYKSNPPVENVAEEPPKLSNEFEEVVTGQDNDDIYVSEGNQSTNNICQPSTSEPTNQTIVTQDGNISARCLLAWIVNEIILPSSIEAGSDNAESLSCVVEILVSSSDKNFKNVALSLRQLLDDENNINLICQHVSNNLNESNETSGDDIDLDKTNGKSSDELKEILSSVSSDSDYSNGMENETVTLLRRNEKLQPFIIPPPSSSSRPSAGILSANFINFLHKVSFLSGIKPPIKNNPFIEELVMSFSLGVPGSDEETSNNKGNKKMQDMVFGNDNQSKVVDILSFLYKATKTNEEKVVFDSEMQKSRKYAVANEKHIVEVREQNLQKQLSPVKEEHLSPSNSGEGKMIPPMKNFTIAPIESLSSPNLNFVVPQISPSPFETAVWSMPSIVALTLTCLGDPAAVCRMKMINRFCYRIITENEHVIMKDAVRLGGLNVHQRPSFWMWISLEKCIKPPLMHTKEKKDSLDSYDTVTSTDDEDDINLNTEKGSAKRIVRRNLPSLDNVEKLEQIGREGKWHSIIKRDVSRAFGNMPPHKTGARFNRDSIVRALVTWGRRHLTRRGLKGVGGCEASPVPVRSSNHEEKDKPLRRLTMSPVYWEKGGDENAVDRRDSIDTTDTISDSGGISPTGSTVTEVFTDCNSSETQDEKKSCREITILGQTSEVVLSGIGLTNEMKVDLQNKLGFILHALSAVHENIGYCQGMDYIVAHLLRILQDKIEWKAQHGTLPSTIRSANVKGGNNDHGSSSENSHVVEETVFRVMHTFLLTYNLRYMYWPELRCLKTCCRVFERLIQKKLPVLADHFDHHDLNIGMFALGWFQTLFLYIPSMPSATINHMWDIWLVERSMKIFFRVGTAILFLSQPILLNHELEGMMTYLNTFPDSTLLNPEILIACALQIKVTNKMLAEIEMDVSRENELAHGVDPKELIQQEESMCACGPGMACSTPG